MGLPAARMGDQVAHSNAMMGLLIGAALGAALAVAVVATGGLAAVAAGAMIAGGLAGGALAGEYVGAASMGPPTGAIMIGSPDVFINGRPAAMTNIAMAICAKEYGVPQPIAQGAATVFIDHMPAARKNDKLVCSAAIIEGSPDVFFDDKTMQTLPISPEVPEWLNTTLQVVAVGALIVGFGAAVVAVGFGAAVVGLAGGIIGGELGTAGGRILGEALGLSESGKRALEVGGGFLGGLLGGSAASKAYEGLGTNAEGVPTAPCEETCTGGEPVSMHTGEELLQLDDFTWQGPLALTWTRLYRTAQSGIDLQLGHGWLTPLDEWIEPDGAGGIVWHDCEGRRIALPLPASGAQGANATERTRVHREGRQLRICPPRGPQRLFRLDAGRSPLQAWRSGDGHRIDLVYEHGRVSALRASWGKALLVEREGHRIRALTPARVTPAGLEPAGAPFVRYAFDENDDLAATLDRLDHGERYRYAGHLITRRTLPTGFDFHFEWDGDGPGARCLRSRGDDGIYDYRFEWDAAHGWSRAIDSRGGMTDYVHDAGGHVLRVTTPEHLTETYRYTDAGLLAEVSGPLGVVARYEYDDVGQLVKSQDAAGNAHAMAYDGEGRLTGHADPLGQARQWRYDDAGRLQQSVDALGNATSFAYNAQGLLSQVRSAAGQVRGLWWDERARLVAELGTDGIRRHFTHDADDRIVAVTSQEKRVRRYEWDAVGRLAMHRDEAGVEVRLRYNESGRLTHWIDAEGRTTEYRYGDGLAQPTARIDPLGRVLRYRYDTERNLVGLVNPNGDEYRLAWDKDGRLVEEVGFDGRAQRYRHDAGGRLVAKEESADDGWQLTQMRRDALGRLVEKTTADGRSARFGYDPLGRLLLAATDDHEVGFDHDPLGRVIAERQGDAQTTHAYDAAGRRVATVLPDGRQLAFEWNGQGRLAGITLDHRPLSAHRWNEFAQEVERTQGALTSRYDYDPGGRLVAQHAVREGSERAVLGRDYRRDALGRIAAIHDLRQGDSRYVYDPAGQLFGVQGTTPEQFAHDPAGNLLADAGTQVAGDRLLMQGDRHFRYDAAGNRVEERRGTGGRIVTRYEYDASHRLAAVHAPDGTSRYRYDALGRRIAKLTPQGETRFFWDGATLLGEARADESRWYVYEPGTFRPLACVRSTRATAPLRLATNEGAAIADAPPSEVFHYHLDHLGTPREMTDARGHVVWSARYRAWGALALADVQEIDNPLRFQGQYHDVETGLHYNFQRYYDPAVGRFVTQDPIGLAGGDNLYRYASDPIQWVDPLGLVGCSPKAKQHILYGDGPGSGGHLWPGEPGKTTFPQSWTPEKVIGSVDDIVTSPSTTWYAQTGNGGAMTGAGEPAKWVSWETRDGVQIRTVIKPATGEVITAFPDNGPIPNLALAK